MAKTADPTLATIGGYTVRRLTEGFPEWRAAGYPIEETTPVA